MNKELLDIYSDYLISQNQYATATGLAAMLDGELSHDQVSRFLHEEDLWIKGAFGVSQKNLQNWPVFNFDY